MKSKKTLPIGKCHCMSDSVDRCDSCGKFICNVHRRVRLLSGWWAYYCLDELCNNANLRSDINKPLNDSLVS